MQYESVEDLVRDIEERPIEASAHVYHPIPFPEFAHLRHAVSGPGVEAKLELVRKVRRRRLAAGLPAERVLDIGANGGLFSFSLAADGAHVTAYEPDDRYGVIGATLARLRAPGVEWHSEAFTAGAMEGKAWDIGLLLSTFQWISAGDERLREAKELLRGLSERTRCLVFELGMNDGKSPITTHKRNHLAAVHGLLVESTTHPHIRLAAANRIWPTRAPWRGWRYTFVCSHDDPGFPEPRYAWLKRVQL